LEMRGLDFIDPIPLTDPRVSPPPKELSRLHFNDLYIAQIQMEESLKKLRKRCWWEFWRPLNYNPDQERLIRNPGCEPGR